jgi:prefoldin subunit 5
MEQIDTKIKELQDEGNNLIDQRNQLNNSLQQITSRIIEIQGALKALSSLKETPKETEVKPKDKKDDSKK